jgi:hypothetical protein
MPPGLVKSERDARLEANMVTEGMAPEGHYAKTR